MATRGTEFIGAELHKQVQGYYDRRVAALEEEIAALIAPTTKERHDEWRDGAENAVHALCQSIAMGTATDAELYGFKIEPAPRPDDHKYRVQALGNQVEHLRRTKDKALAYISSLAADQGVVTLAAADLRRIGYAL